MSSKTTSRNFALLGDEKGHFRFNRSSLANPIRSFPIVAVIHKELLWFRFAVASYTEGLKARGGDVVVNTQLYTNRAAAQFHIGNYRYWKIHVKKACAEDPVSEETTNQIGWIVRFYTWGGGGGFVD
jgi:hypothetical protein